MFPVGCIMIYIMSYLCTVLDGSIFAECWSRSGWDMPSFLPMHQRCLTIYDGCWEKIQRPLRTRRFSVNDPGLFGTAGNSCFEEVRYWCDLCHRLYSVPIPTCILCKVSFFWAVGTIWIFEDIDYRWLAAGDHVSQRPYRHLVGCTDLCVWLPGGGLSGRAVQRWGDVVVAQNHCPPIRWLKLQQCQTMYSYR